MSEQESVEYGLHYHHEGLITVGRGFDERRAEIINIKDLSEHELRLKRMRRLTDEEVRTLPPMMAESNRLRAEGDRLWAEGYSLRAESNRLWAESNRLWDESNRLERDALVAWHARVCVPECLASLENGWNIFWRGEQ